jgi:cystathionine beta-synthase
VVVLIFHDHGSRYVGKIYNDQWMVERGFLSVKTFRDIVAGRGKSQKLVSIEPNQSVADAVALMRKYDIEHIPVMRGDEILGSVSESGLFQQLFSNAAIKQADVLSVLEPAFPIVDFLTPIEKLSTLINKENGAVLGKDELGYFHILTKYDVLQALGK